jgi:uncharacterized protein (TIGR02646 family)
LDSSEAEKRRGEMAEFIAYSLKGSQQRRPPVDRQFLHHPEIQSALMGLFNGACAYCETPVGASAAICHHRPPGLAADAHGKTDLLHYAWLAYDWDNLYLACDVCSRTKANRFLVAGERGRLDSPIGRLRATENELLLDPCFHDPSEHLRFLSTGHVRSRSRLGEATIETLNLNRPALVHERLRAFEDFCELIVVGHDLNIEATGAPSPWGRNVLATSLGVPVRHAGASSLALLRMARRIELPTRSMSDLLSHLLAMMPAARAEVLSQARGTIGEDRDLDPEAEPAEPAESRVFHLRDHPLAELPLTAIRIRNFKPLKDIVFQVPAAVDDPEAMPCLLLLGENAAGKSSVLEAVALALLGSDEIAELNSLLPEEEITPKILLRRPSRREATTSGQGEVSVELHFAESSEPIRISGSTGDDRFEGTRKPAKLLLAYGPRRFFRTLPTRRFRAPARRVRSLFDPLATIANPIDWLRRSSPSVFDAAARALREILMLGDDAVFLQKDDQVLIDTGAECVPLSEMSVGYKSVIAMATDIMRELMYHYDNLEFAHAVVLVDEIETHLHPRWKMRIVKLLRQAFPKVHFIFTTHDPLCLRGMYDGEVFVLQRSGKDREVELVADLPSIRGMRAEQILMSEFFGLGSTDPDTDAKLIRYQNLVSHGIDTPEVERLRAEIEETMKVGDTLQEQVVAEALRKANIDPVAPLGKVKTRSRKEMVQSLLDNIQRVRASQEPGA